jgi:hypothetical protein
VRLGWNSPGDQYAGIEPVPPSLPRGESQVHSPPPNLLQPHRSGESPHESKSAVGLPAEGVAREEEDTSAYSWTSVEMHSSPGRNREKSKVSHGMCACVHTQRT